MRLRGSRRLRQRFGVPPGSPSDKGRAGIWSIKHVTPPVKLLAEIPTSVTLPVHSRHCQRRKEERENAPLASRDGSYVLGLSVSGVGGPRRAQPNQTCDPTYTTSKPGKGTSFRPTGVNPLYGRPGVGPGGLAEAPRPSAWLGLAAMGRGPCRPASPAWEGA